MSIHRSVILVHPRSELGATRDLTVDVATSMDWTIGTVRDSDLALQARQIAEVERLITRDHHFRETRRGDSLICEATLNWPICALLATLLFG